MLINWLIWTFVEPPREALQPVVQVILSDQPKKWSFVETGKVNVWKCKILCENEFYFFVLYFPVLVSSGIRV